MNCTEMRMLAAKPLGIRINDENGTHMLFHIHKLKKLGSSPHNMG